MRTTAPLPGILLVAFGVTTRYGKPALTAFTERVREAFPGYAVRWAFTARHKANRPTLAGVGGTDTVHALDLFAGEGITRVAVQPLHLVDGVEHAALCRQVFAWQKNAAGASVSVGAPLLADETAMRAVLRLMSDIRPPGAEKDEAAVWVGHGTREGASGGYARLAALAAEQSPPVYMGCLLGGPSPESVIDRLRSNGKTRVRLMPLFALSGYHAAKDVAGKNDGSWRSRLLRSGITARACLRGMVEYEAFAALWLCRLKEALERV